MTPAGAETRIQLPTDIPSFPDQWRELAVRIEINLGEFFANYAVVLRDKPSMSCEIVAVDPATGKRDSKNEEGVIKAPDDSAKNLTSQLGEVLRQADLRKSRSEEILTQLDTTFGYFAAVLNIQPQSHPATFELFETSVLIARVVVLRAKNHFKRVRPVQLSPLVQPMILTPGHAAYPSGHATHSKMIADILTHCADGRPAGIADILDKLARRITENRTIAGVHFPDDNSAGRDLGAFLAECLTTKRDSMPAIQALIERASLEITGRTRG
ncbi:MAG: phosphatase PAP2 family protein [Blastocatellia bacterium]